MQGGSIVSVSHSQIAMSFRVGSAGGAPVMVAATTSSFTCEVPVATGFGTSRSMGVSISMSSVMTSVDV